MKNFTNEIMLNALQLPIIKDLDTFSNAIGLSKRLIYVLSNNTDDYYKNFIVKKRNGEDRIISSPSYSLKLVQRWILKNILEKIAVSNEAMAFKSGTSIKDNADYHKFSLYLLQIDIKDFFNSIKREKVYFIFRNVGYNSFISSLLTNLCTLNDSLPQGGITSPYLSNLICYNLDKRLTELCSRREILYTRYADDLTFSCDNKEKLKKLKSVFEKILNEEGYELNDLKTRYLSPSSNKQVTGLSINNNEVKVAKKLKRKVRAIIHRSIVSANFKDNDVIRGYISFIDSIETGYKKRIINYIYKLNEEYSYFKDIVDAYNNNKLYIDMKDMTFNELTINTEEEYYFHLQLLSYRYSYLNKNGLLTDDLRAIMSEIDDQAAGGLDGDNEDEIPF